MSDASQREHEKLDANGRAMLVLLASGILTTNWSGKRTTHSMPVEPDHVRKQSDGEER